MPYNEIIKAMDEFDYIYQLYKGKYIMPEKYYYGIINNTTNELEFYLSTDLPVKPEKLCELLELDGYHAQAATEEEYKGQCADDSDYCCEETEDEDNLEESVDESISQKEDVKCKDCDYLMFSDMYGECSKGYKGIVQPNDSCGKGQKKFTKNNT